MAVSAKHISVVFTSLRTGLCLLALGLLLSNRFLPGLGAFAAVWAIGMVKRSTARPGSLLAGWFLPEKILSIAYFSLLMTHKACPTWFAALVISAILLKGFGLMAIHLGDGVGTSFVHPRLAPWNTGAQFVTICLFTAAIHTPKAVAFLDSRFGMITYHLVYAVLAGLQVTLFFRYFYLVQAPLGRLFRIKQFPGLLPRAR